MGLATAAAGARGRLSWLASDVTLGAVQDDAVHVAEVGSASFSTRQGCTIVQYHVKFFDSLQELLSNVNPQSLVSMGESVVSLRYAL